MLKLEHMEQHRLQLITADNLVLDLYLQMVVSQRAILKVLVVLAAMEMLVANHQVTKLPAAAVVQAVQVVE